jgi:hypothetical protein
VGIVRSASLAKAASLNARDRSAGQQIVNQLDTAGIGGYTWGFAPQGT